MLKQYQRIKYYYIIFIFRSTFNGVDPCLFSSSKEKIQKEKTWQRRFFQASEAQAPNSSEPFQKRTIEMNTQLSSKKHILINRRAEMNGCS